MLETDRYSDAFLSCYGRRLFALLAIVCLGWTFGCERTVAPTLEYDLGDVKSVRESLGMSTEDVDRLKNPGNKVASISEDDKENEASSDSEEANEADKEDSEDADGGSN